LLVKEWNVAHFLPWNICKNTSANILVISANSVKSVGLIKEVNMIRYMLCSSVSYSSWILRGLKLSNLGRTYYLLQWFYSGSATPNVGREFTQGQPSRQKNTAQKSEQRKLPEKN
jgi:hypothetical protein